MKEKETKKKATRVSKKKKKKTMTMKVSESKSKYRTSHKLDYLLDKTKTYYGLLFAANRIKLTLRHCHLQKVNSSRVLFLYEYHRYTTILMQAALSHLIYKACLIVYQWSMVLSVSLIRYPKVQLRGKKRPK